MPLGIHLYLKIECHCEPRALGRGRSNLQTKRRLLTCTRFAKQIVRSLAPPARAVVVQCRCDITLRLIGYIDRDVIEEEISVAIACHIDHADAEVRVAEIAYSPRASPCI